MTEGTSVSWRSSQSGWAFILRWTIASVLGWFSYAILYIPIFGIPMIFAVAAATCPQGMTEYCFPVGSLPPEENRTIVAVAAAFAGLLGLLVGTILGFFQWLVLRREVQRSGLWILGNLLGVAAVFALPFLWLILLNKRIDIAWFEIPLPVMGLAGLLVGLLVGVVEWPMFPPKAYKTRSWPLISMLIWIFASLSTAALVTFANAPDEYVIALAIVGFALAQTALTGIALLWMFRRKQDVSVALNADHSL